MGACLSCLGLSRQDSSDPERAHLFYSDDPYNQSGNSYGTYGAGQNPGGLPAQHAMNPEDLKREQEALEGITRWTSDQIVEIFPHHHSGTLPKSNSNLNLNGGAHHNTNNNNNNSQQQSPSHETLMSLIPGDKSTKSFRIYPASGPSSATSTLSRTSSSRATNGKKASKIFVKLEVDST